VRNSKKNEAGNMDNVKEKEREREREREREMSIIG
jgi:hypothetical protein